MTMTLPIMRRRRRTGGGGGAPTNDFTTPTFLALFDGDTSQSLHAWSIAPIDQPAVATFTQVPAATGTGEVLLSDSFTAANGTALTSLGWTKTVLSGSFTADVQNNQARLLQTTQGTGTLTKDAGVSDCSVSCDVKLVAGVENTMVLIGRWSDINNLYYIDLYDSGDLISIIKREAGVNSVLASAAVTLTTNTWYRLRVRFEGNDIIADVDGKYQISVTNAFNNTATKFGFGINNSVSNGDTRFDNFAVRSGTMGGFDLAFGRANCITLDGSGKALAYADDIGEADVVVEALVILGAASAESGLLLRGSDVNNYYTLTAKTGVGLQLFKWEAGAKSAALASIAPTLAADTPYLIRAVCSGPTITAVLVGDGIDSVTPLYYESATFNETATFHGFWTESLATRFDDFQVDALDTGHATLNDALVQWLPGNETVSSSNHSAVRYDTSPADWNNLLDSLGSEGARSVSGGGPGGQTCVRLDRTKLQYGMCEPGWQLCLAFASRRIWYRQIWVKLRSVANSQIIWSQSDGTAGGRDRAWDLLFDSADSKIKFRVYDATDVLVASADSAAVSIDTWYLVAFWDDATDVHIAINNGTAVDATPSAAPRQSTTIPIRIGTGAMSDGNFHGDLDWLMAGTWLRIPTAGERADLYASGSGYDPTGQRNSFTRKNLELPARLLINRLAGIAKNGSNGWDSLAGGCVSWLWADVDGDGANEFVALGISRNLWAHAFKRDGKVAWANTDAAVTAKAPLFFQVPVAVEIAYLDLPAAKRQIANWEAPALCAVNTVEHGDIRLRLCGRFDGEDNLDIVFGGDVERAALEQCRASRAIVIGPLARAADGIETFDGVALGGISACWIGIKYDRDAAQTSHVSNHVTVGMRLGKALRPDG